jgi:hypothetical protein
MRVRRKEPSVSLIRDKWWVPPEELGQEELALRTTIHEAMLRVVTAGCDDRAPRSLFHALATCDGDGEEVARRATESLDLMASDLPGRWIVLSESWTGKHREYCYIKALYLDRAGGTAIVISGDASLGEEPDVDSVWLGVDELEAMLGAVGAPPFEARMSAPSA